MTRTVKVTLDVNEQPYVHGVQRATAATERLDDAVDDVSQSARETAAGMGSAQESIADAGQSARGTARSLDDLRQDAARLDRQIDETARSVRDLARALAATDDAATRLDLSERLTVQRRQLRDLADLRRLIDVPDVDVTKAGVRVGSRLAEGIATGLSRTGGPVVGALEGVVGSLPPKLQAAVGAAVVAGVVSVAPIVGGSLAAAVVGAVGVGGVVGGLAVAARHQGVRQAASELADTVMAVLERSVGVAFVDPALDGLNLVRGTIDDIEGDLGRIAQSAARFVRPLTFGVAGFVREILPGLERAVDRAGPVIDEIAAWGPRLGRLLSDIMSQFADDSGEAAQALRALWVIFELGVRMVASSINTLTEAFKWADLLGSALIGRLPQAINRYAYAEAQAAAGGATLSGSLADVISGFDGVADGADDATDELEELQRAIDDLFGRTLDLDEATIRAQRGLIELRKALTEGKRVLEGNSQAALDNRQAVLEQIQVYEQLRKARVAQGMAIDEANAKYEQELDSLRDLMIQLGYNERAVNNLIDRYRDIPRQVTTQIVAMGTDQAGRVIESYLSWLRRIPPKVRTRMVVEQQTVRGGPREFRWGGIVEHARMGLLREAHIAPPTAPARYAYAEPATGGELFAPRYGDFDRTRRIVSYAVENWWGGWHKFVPHFAARQTVPTRGITIENLNIRAYSDRFSLRQVTDELAMYGVR